MHLSNRFPIHIDSGRFEGLNPDGNVRAWTALGWLANGGVEDNQPPQGEPKPPGDALENKLGGKSTLLPGFIVAPVFFS
jgi:hypothetical protein